MTWHELEVQKQMEDMESSSSVRRKTVAGGGKDLGFGKAQLEIKKLSRSQRNF